jgi:hypothetical protein
LADSIRLRWKDRFDNPHLFAAAQPSIAKSVAQPISSQFHKVFKYSKVARVVLVAESDTTT